MAAAPSIRSASVLSGFFSFFGSQKVGREFVGSKVSKLIEFHIVGLLRVVIVCLYFEVVHIENSEFGFIGFSNSE